jgi:hypothetical protein
MSSQQYNNLINGRSSRDSVDTYTKQLNRLASQYTKSNGAKSLTRAINLYEIAWKVQCEFRGEQDPRALNAYMNMYNIQDRVRKAKIGRRKSLVLERAKQEERELRNNKKNANK